MIRRGNRVVSVTGSRDSQFGPNASTCVLARRTKARALQADCSSRHSRVFRRMRKTLLRTLGLQRTMRPSLSAFASRPNPLSRALTISILGSRESFQEKRPLDSVAARASGRTAQIGQVGTLGIDGRSRLLLAYFRHTEPESGANGNATCRLTDSQSLSF